MKAYCYKMPEDRARYLVEQRGKPIREPTQEQIKEFLKRWIGALYEITKKQPMDALTKWVERRAKELGIAGGKGEV